MGISLLQCLIIPLFVAYVMRHYKETATIYYKNKEVELSAGILSSINDAPDDYMLLIEAGTQEREEYLSTLSTLFAQYEDSSSLGTSRVFAIVKSMQTWMRSLPDYTKKYTGYDYNGTVVRVDNSTKIVRNDLLKFEVNAHEMLFTIQYAIRTYNQHREDWNGIVKRGMLKDYSWMHSAKTYEKLYDIML